MDASEFHDYSPDEGIERERIVGDSLLLNCGVSKGVETGSIVQDRPDGFGGAGVQRLPTRRRGGWPLRLRRGPALVSSEWAARSCREHGRSCRPWVSRDR